MAEWEELLSAIEGRMERVAGTRDPAPVLDEAALDEARQLMRMMQDREPDLRGLYLLGWLFWYRYQALPEGQDEPELRAATTAFAPCFIAGVSGLPPPLVPLLADQAIPAATAMLDDALQSPDRDLSATVDLWRRIVDATPADHPERAERLSSLGGALQARFGRTEVLADLDAAVEAARTALKGIPASHPDRARYLFNLGSAVGARFWRTEAIADLDAAIEALQAAVNAAPPGHPDREASLSNLESALTARFRRTEALTDLDEAIETLRALVDATPPGHPDLAQRLARLSGALYTRFARTGTPGDLDEAIEAGRKAADATPPGHPDLAERLASLGSALQTRFARTRALDDLDEAIEAGRKARDATPAGHPDQPKILSDLGLALQNRFEQAGAVADVNAAVEAGRAAAGAIPPEHPDRAVILSNLGLALRMRFEYGGGLADLDEAIRVGRAAVEVTPEGHPNRGAMLSNLGAALRERFERTGEQHALDEAIVVSRAAVAALPANRPDRAGGLANLGLVLRERFEYGGGLADLDEAIQVGRAAVEVTPEGHPNRGAMLSNLGAALRVRFEYGGGLADLDEAIQVGRAAVDATLPGHPNRGAMLSNLGAALRERFERTGEQHALDEAIAVSSAAADSLPAGHPGRPAVLSNIGAALRIRFESTGNSDDLTRAVDIAQLALAATPPDDPDRAAKLTDLGQLLGDQYEHEGNTASGRQSIDLFEQAARTSAAPPMLRLGAAISWGAAAALIQDWDRSVEAYTTAIYMLPMMTWHGLAQQDREHTLGSITGLAADAAAVALNAGSPVQALELLEHGRALMVAQSLDIRSDLTNLKEQAPALAERMELIRHALLEGSLLDSAQTEDSRGVPISNISALRRRESLARDWDSLVVEVRSLPGFSNFLQPTSFEQLTAAANQGPVVILNASRYRCDALILTLNGLRVLQLPGLRFEDIVDNASRLSAVFAHGMSKEGQSTVRHILGWLWDVLAEPILADLGLVARPGDNEQWQRVWWCPTGPLALLPIHAAARFPDSSEYYSANRSDAVIDRVISSYTLTLRSLLERRAHSREAEASQTSQLLAVGVSSAPGLAPLQAVRAELESVREYVPDGTFLIGEEATRERIISELSRHTWLHFSGHSIQDQAEPSNSGLLCYDYQEGGPLRIADILQLDLKAANLAFLSASDTAQATASLVDEAMHVAGALHAAGFAHVIGAQWPISDVIAPQVASHIYAELCGTSGTEAHSGDVAMALHRTIRLLRARYPYAPSLWAPYVHFGI
jgi:tetratricopeptide (TPR) repeat protein